MNNISAIVMTRTCLHPLNYLGKMWWSDGA